MHSMHATLLGLPESVSDELEQAFNAEGLALEEIGRAHV